MANEQSDEGDVAERLKEIQTRHRGRVKWQVSKHTAEMAIGALGAEPRREPRKRSGKTRRRKRHKRLL